MLIFGSIAATGAAHRIFADILPHGRRQPLPSSLMLSSSVLHSTQPPSSLTRRLLPDHGETQPTPFGPKSGPSWKWPAISGSYYPIATATSGGNPLMCRPLPLAARPDTAVRKKFGEHIGAVLRQARYQAESGNAQKGMAGYLVLRAQVPAPLGGSQHYLR
jgi:hypothetical protein